PRAIRAVAMDGEALAVFVGHLSRGADFVERVGLEAGEVLVGAGGGVHFDDVDAGNDFLAYDAHHIGEIIRAPAGRGKEARGRGSAGEEDTVAGAKQAGAE